MSTQPHGTVPVFTIGDRLRKARELTGKDQTEFAEAIGISRGSVSNYERADRPPRPIVLRAWSMATGVPVEWLLTGEGYSQPDPDPGTSAATHVRLARLAAQKRRHADAGANPGYDRAA